MTIREDATMPKTLADVPAFLDMQWMATFATVDRAGKPHAVPVWFTFDDGKLHVTLTGNL